MDTLSTGELAKRCGVSADTIRHYERHGLLPTADRTPSGHRVFPAAATERVRVARNAIRIGFSIEELTRIFRQRTDGDAPCHQVRALAAAKLRALDDSIAQMTHLREQLVSTLREWDERLERQERNERVFLLDSLTIKENTDEARPDGNRNHHDRPAVRPRMRRTRTQKE